LRLLQDLEQADGPVPHLGSRSAVGFKSIASILAWTGLLMSLLWWGIERLI
jgi:hypothetical protein